MILIHLENQLKLIGRPTFIPKVHTISTPHFPALYPRDFSTEHVIICEQNTRLLHSVNVTVHVSNGSNGANTTTAEQIKINDECRIRVTFTDFQLALASTIEVGTQ